MASEAYGNVEKAMDAAREAELAAYIMRDVELRQQNAIGTLSINPAILPLLSLQHCQSNRSLQPLYTK